MTDLTVTEAKDLLDTIARLWPGTRCTVEDGRILIHPQAALAPVTKPPATTPAVDRPKPVRQPPKAKPTADRPSPETRALNFGCTDCDRRFVNAQGLGRHRSIAHEKPERTGPIATIGPAVGETQAEWEQRRRNAAAAAL